MNELESPRALYKKIKAVMEVKELSARGAFLREVEISNEELEVVAFEAEFAAAQVFAEVTLQTTKAALVAAYFALKKSNDTDVETAEAGATALQLIESAFEHFGWSPADNAPVSDPNGE